MLLNLALISLAAHLVQADVKQDETLPVRFPSTFGYKALEDQKKNDKDQFLRSNIDNEANKRNTQTEAPLDMLPFRQPEVGPVRSFRRGVPVKVPLTWNNPHDSDCEVNAFITGQRQVVPLRRPSPNGGGYANHEFSFQFPLDFPGCVLPAEGCVVQIYCHSVETRTYAIGYDFVLLDQPQDGQTAASLTKYDLPRTIVQPALHYWDSFDTSHTDSQFSQYRGQQRQFVRDEVLAAIELRCHLGNEGLVPLGPVNPKRAELEGKVNAAIQAAEAVAIKNNQAAQAALDAGRTPGTPRTCFQGELYSVVNNPDCKREYTNTYVTNVGYRQLVAQFTPQFAAANLKCYQAKLKGHEYIGATPFDQYGAMVDKNKKIIVPKVIPPAPAPLPDLPAYQPPRPTPPPYVSPKPSPQPYVPPVRSSSKAPLPATTGYAPPTSSRAPVVVTTSAAYTPPQSSAVAPKPATTSAAYTPPQSSASAPKPATTTKASPPVYGTSMPTTSGTTSPPATGNTTPPSTGSASSPSGQIPETPSAPISPPSGDASAPTTGTSGANNETPAGDTQITSSARSQPPALAVFVVAISFLGLF